MNDFESIGPNWNEIPKVKAFTTLAKSETNQFITFAGESEKSKLSKKYLEEFISPKKPIHWLKQEHNNVVLELPNENTTEADGAMTSETGIVCAVRTADCLPIVFCNSNGSKVGIVHAGWKGLERDIISNFIKKFKINSLNILAWIGPGISMKSYEVGNEVYEVFIKKDLVYKSAFEQTSKDKFHLDISKVAKIQLLSAGLVPENISGAEWDTFTDLRFHSSRRDGSNSGRMATVVWIEPQS